MFFFFDSVQVVFTICTAGNYHSCNLIYRIICWRCFLSIITPPGSQWTSINITEKKLLNQASMCVQTSGLIALLCSSPQFLQQLHLHSSCCQCASIWPDPAPHRTSKDTTGLPVSSFFKKKNQKHVLYFKGCQIIKILNLINHRASAPLVITVHPDVCSAAYGKFLPKLQ